MAEDSFWWTTSGSPSGHQKSSYTQSNLSTIAAVIAACNGFEGVAPSYLNALAGSVPGANTARIATGGAVVDGKPYKNDANVDVTIPSAVGGGNTRIDRIVLRASWSAFTVTITRIAGTDAASPSAPAITQTSGTTYDIKLYQALVNTSGTVTLTDERTWAQSGTNSLTDGAVTEAKIADLAVTLNKIGAGAVNTGKLAELSVTTSKIVDANVTLAKIADDSIDDTKAGSRVPQFYRRQGGSATDWGTAGTTDRTPGAVRMQGGVASIGGGATVSITFPVAFSGTPIVMVSSLTQNRFAYTSVPTATGFDIFTTDLANASAGTATVTWLAIGPE